MRQEAKQNSASGTIFKDYYYYYLFTTTFGNEIKFPAKM